jgi:DNA helicase-2/ATP-dependent DNA helicase PcrA
MSEFPTEAQKRVITHRGRPLVVVAGPGTGKTRTIVQRMIDLVVEDPDRVVSFITFTRTSRRDTEKKLAEAAGQRAADIAEGDFPRVSTLHRFAKAVVHRYAGLVGRQPDFGVLAGQQGEKAILVAEVVEDLGLAVQQKWLEDTITGFRSTGEWSPSAEPTVHQSDDILRAFDLLLRFYNTFDMEGLVVAACEILSNRPEDLPPIFLQVDEYQDLNAKDQELVRLAGATPSSEVVVVGDDAQSIYGRRHARPVGIRELWESEEWERIPFPECHRLPAHVLRAAHALIDHRGYLGAQVILPPDDGRRLLTLQCTQRVQLRAVARHMQLLLHNGRKADGAPITYGDLMVLCPTNQQVGQVAVALSEKHGIPTRKKLAGTVPQDVWKLLLVLRLLAHSDPLALRQWLAVAGLPSSEIRALRIQAMQANQSLYEYCSTLGEDRIANIFLAVGRLRDSMVDPIRFRETLCGFPGLLPTRDVVAVVDEIVEYLPAVGRMIRHVYERHGVLDAEAECDEMPDEDKVLVTTMHSAKGLEADFVFIMWLNDWLIPSPRRDLAEEERVLYVALTRARQDVVLTFEERYDPQSRRYLRQEAMSPFLRSIGNHLQIIRVTASTLAQLT